MYCEKFPIYMLFLFCNQINNDVFVLVDIYTMQLICALLVFLFLAVANVTRVILRPLSALSLDEGLNALNGKTPSAAVWFRRPIKCQILALMRISDFSL